MVELVGFENDTIRYVNPGDLIVANYNGDQLILLATLIDYDGNIKLVDITMGNRFSEKNYKSGVPLTRIAKDEDLTIKHYIPINSFNITITKKK